MRTEGSRKGREEELNVQLPREGEGHSHTSSTEPHKVVPLSCE